MLRDLSAMILECGSEKWRESRRSGGLCRPFSLSGKLGAQWPVCLVSCLCAVGLSARGSVLRGSVTRYSRAYLCFFNNYLRLAGALRFWNSALGVLSMGLPRTRDSPAANCSCLLADLKSERESSLLVSANATSWRRTSLPPLQPRTLKLVGNGDHNIRLFRRRV